MNRNFTILNLITLFSCILYTFLQISTVFDISFFAFWINLIFSGFLVYFLFYLLQYKQHLKCHKIANKLLEYVPCVFLVTFVMRRAGTFGTSYAFDIITVILWIVCTVLSYIESRFFLSEKFFYKKNADLMKKLSLTEQELNSKPKNIQQKITFEVFDWIDAFVQTVFLVVLINIFVFQLYEIPSESMVDQFLVGDRVLVLKPTSGPKFPLTQIGLPNTKKYSRGDIAVFHNPHYPENRKADIRNFTSQLVFLLTLTLKNINVDENGELLYDPLVKRVCGVPGEQLFMLDGKLYHRTAESKEFSIVIEDEKWAKWNLNELPNSVKQNVKVFPFTPAIYEKILQEEEARRNFDIKSFMHESKKIAKQFEDLYNKNKGTKKVIYLEDDIKTILPSELLNVKYLFENDQEITRTIIQSEVGNKWFSEFMTSWIDDVSNDVIIGNKPYKNDLYEDSLFRINLMAKQAFGKLVLQDARLFFSDTESSLWGYDEIRTECLKQIKLLEIYIFYNDSRNMMTFPANTETGEPTYIPENSYFMMGDNRYNSLDMRHSYDKFSVRLMPEDEYSINYLSCLKPQYVKSKAMMGSPSVRFWPISRFSVIK